MSATIKRTSGSHHVKPIVIGRNSKNHANDPFFVKKANQAKEIIEKFGLPDKEKKS